MDLADDMEDREAALQSRVQEIVAHVRAEAAKAGSGHTERMVIAEVISRLVDVVILEARHSYMTETLDLLRGGKPLAD